MHCISSERPLNSRSFRFNLKLRVKAIYKAMHFFFWIFLLIVFASPIFIHAVRNLKIYFQAQTSINIMAMFMLEFFLWNTRLVHLMSAPWFYSDFGSFWSCGCSCCWFSRSPTSQKCPSRWLSVSKYCVGLIECVRCFGKVWHPIQAVFPSPARL